jgi:hypothetical protein
MKEKRPVLYVYKGVKVRQVNRVELLIPEPVFKKLIDATEESGMSIHKVLYYSGRPCERCDPEIRVYDTEGKPHVIKKGILNLPESNGINIIQKAKNRCKKP